MTEECATREPLMVEPSLRGAHVRFVVVVVAHAGIALIAAASGAVSFGGVIPWRITEWTIAALVASVFIVKFSRCETGPIFAVADDLLPGFTLLAVTLALATLAEGQTVLALEAIGLAGCGLALFAPRFRRDPLPAWVRTAPRLTIGVANVFVDNPTPHRTAAELVHSGVDVLVLNEVTDRFLESIDDLGGNVWFPHRIVDRGADPDYTTAVFSRLAFAEGSGVVVVPGPLRTVRVVIDVDGAPLQLIAMHLEANLERGGHPRWRAQMAALTAIAMQAPTRTVIAGDFNASVDRPPLEELLEHGYEDAHVALGRGLDLSLKLAPTGLLAAVGPVVRVDHMLTGGGVRAVEINRLRAPGSDHVPFAATVAIRRVD
jgi:endonuclease/exonuclease/phosphatase family metal-dependent hydrolase